MPKIKIKKNQYYIVRTVNAGVFFGKIKFINKESILMQDVRKLWYWEGAYAVEELALHGTKKPNNCRFTVIIPEMEIAEPVQIIPCTKESVESIQAVEIWQT